MIDRRIGDWMIGIALNNYRGSLLRWKRHHENWCGCLTAKCWMKWKDFLSRVIRPVYILLPIADVATSTTCSHDCESVHYSSFINNLDGIKSFGVELFIWMGWNSTMGHSKQYRPCEWEQFLLQMSFHKEWHSHNTEGTWIATNRYTTSFSSFFSRPWFLWKRHMDLLCLLDAILKIYLKHILRTPEDKKKQGLRWIVKPNTRTFIYTYITYK